MLKTGENTPNDDQTRDSHTLIATEFIYQTFDGDNVSYLGELTRDF